MIPNLRAVITASALLVAMTGGTAFAQKQGGVFRMYTQNSPASMSPHEEATVFSQGRVS
jgi:hypothetical protein